MSTAQRVSRGFHRLALFLAAIPLVLGVILSVSLAVKNANEAFTEQPGLICARDYLIKYHGSREMALEQAIGMIDLAIAGCSNRSKLVSSQVALDTREEDFDYATSVASAIAVGLAITLAVSFAVYGTVRAIGWVIGGFAAS
jgi:hypothetical protein